MRKSKRILSVALSFMFVMSVTVPPAFAENSSSISPDLIKAQQIIEKVKGSNYTTSDISANDIQLMLSKGGKEGQQTLDQLLSHAKPIDKGVSQNDEYLAESKVISKHSKKKYSYLHTVGTSTETYVDDSQFSDKPSFSDSLANESNNAMLTSYPTNWYEQSPQSYENTRSTCKLLVLAENGNHVGSGFLLYGSHVGTAGHCLYDPKDLGGWAKSVIVIPSYTNGSYPYGSAASTSLETGGNWHDNNDMSDDWGIVHLNTAFTIGHLSLTAPGDSIQGWTVRDQGYPGDSSYLYLQNCNVDAVNSSRIISTSQQSIGGMSGGPCLESQNRIIGIIHGYWTSGPNTGDSVVVKLDNWICNKMNSYRD